MEKYSKYNELTIPAAVAQKEAREALIEPCVQALAESDIDPAYSCYFTQPAKEGRMLTNAGVDIMAHFLDGKVEVDPADLHLICGEIAKKYADIMNE